MLGKSGSSYPAPGFIARDSSEFACLRPLFRRGIAAEGLSALRSVRFSTSKGGPHCDIAASRIRRNYRAPTPTVARRRRSLACVSISGWGQSRDMKSPLSLIERCGNPIVMQPLHPPSWAFRPEENPWKFLLARACTFVKLIVVTAFGKE